MTRRSRNRIIRYLAASVVQERLDRTLLLLLFQHSLVDLTSKVTPAAYAKRTLSARDFRFARGAMIPRSRRKIGNFTFGPRNLVLPLPDSRFAEGRKEEGDEGNPFSRLHVASCSDAPIPRLRSARRMIDRQAQSNCFLSLDIALISSQVLRVHAACLSLVMLDKGKSHFHAHDVNYGIAASL